MKRMIAILALATAMASTFAVAQSSNDNYQTNQAGAQKITNGPVIEYTSDHSAMIAWSTKYPAGTYIAYGTDQNNLSQRTERAWGGTNHRLEIKNLQPQTTYYFQVRSDNANGSGGYGADVESPVASFTTVAKGAQPDRANRNVGVNGQSGTAAQPAMSSSAHFEPLYRLAGYGEHFFTTNADEYKSLPSQGVYRDEGIAGYVASSQIPGTEPFYRLSNSSTHRHFYTTVSSEEQQAQSNGFNVDGVIGYIATTQLPGTVPLYRLRGSSGDHFYTTNQSEMRSAESQGYKQEGIAGYIWSQPQQ